MDSVFLDSVFADSAFLLFSCGLWYCCLSCCLSIDTFQRFYIHAYHLHVAHVLFFYVIYYAKSTFRIDVQFIYYIVIQRQKINTLAHYFEYFRLPANSVLHPKKYFIRKNGLPFFQQSVFHGRYE